MPTRIYKRFEHKFFDDLITMLSSIGGILVTAETFHQNGFSVAPKDPKYYMEFAGSTFQIKLTWYPFNTFKKIITNDWPDEIQLTEDEYHVKNPSFKIESPQFRNFHGSCLQSNFIKYYESYKPEIERIAGTDPYAWPIPWNFARVIRNACAHNGVICFENLKAKSISWKTFIYSPQDNGKPIFFTDISIVELIFLMEEMNKVLP